MVGLLGKTMGSVGLSCGTSLRVHADQMVTDYAQLVPEVQKLWGEI